RSDRGRAIPAATWAASLHQHLRTECLGERRIKVGVWFNTGANEDDSDRDPAAFAGLGGEISARYSLWRSPLDEGGAPPRYGVHRRGYRAADGGKKSATVRQWKKDIPQRKSCQRFSPEGRSDPMPRLLCPSATPRHYRVAPKYQTEWIDLSSRDNVY